MTAVEPDRLARAAWSGLSEPGDTAATQLVDLLGPAGALDWVRAAVEEVGSSGRIPRRALGQRGGILDRRRDGGAEDELDGFRHDYWPPEHPGPPPLTAHDLTRAVSRWANRGLPDAPAALAHLEAVGGQLVCPGDPQWPTGLADLGAEAPFCLWLRGRLEPGGLSRRSVAVVGSRGSTTYGERWASELGAELADRGFSVVSGGAFGIDAAAHRGTLAAGGTTVIVVAGGVDRVYPARHQGLFAEVVAQGGGVVAEVPPGSVPSRVRFLQRNRLIAAAARATVVVEAALRSGALNTAGHATRLHRPVGALPGPVTSVASGGCHELIRRGEAVCVTSAADVAELAGDFGVDAAPELEVPAGPADDLDDVARHVLDAVPLSRGVPAESILRVAGVATSEGRGALGRLELRGLVLRKGDRWVRQPVE